MFKKVLIGVDGRDGGRDAIALAQNLGGPRAHYVLANVVSGSLSSGAGAFWADDRMPICADHAQG